MNGLLNGTAQQSNDGRAQVSAIEVLRSLAARDYPITGQRRELVGLIMSRSTRFTAEELLQLLQVHGLRSSRATLFRTLELLTKLGYLGRVSDGGHLAYTVCGPDHHYHLVCSGCGEVLHLDPCPALDLVVELQARTGYRIDGHSLELSGVCPSCQRKGDPQEALRQDSAPCDNTSSA
jgi:Fur family transcriptional regulator, ferric uptake regulator